MCNVANLLLILPSVRFQILEVKWFGNFPPIIGQVCGATQKPDCVFSGKYAVLFPELILARLYLIWCWKPILNMFQFLNCYSFLYKRFFKKLTSNFIKEY